MKEYLEKQADGSYKLVMRGIVGKDGDIEVPEGADVAFKKKYGDGLCFFQCVGDNGADWCSETRKWISRIHPVDDWYFKNSPWQRHTQPEELPFVDSLNDQYAEIEQVRQQVNSLPELKHDFVNHPKHYCDHPSGIECIDAIEAGMSEEMFEGYLKGCCNKYLWRYKIKGGSESLRKAQWYLDRLIKLNEKIESRN